MLNVLLVDDHPALLAGIQTMLEPHGIQVNTCASSLAALELIQGAAFDVYVFDIQMPDIDGILLAKHTFARLPEAVVLLITGEEPERYLPLLTEPGVSGIIPKAYDAFETAAAIRLAVTGKVVLPLQLARRFGFSGVAVPKPALAHPLTDKELEILDWIARGKKNKEIAELLYTGQRNVEHSLTNIFQKLGVSSRYEAIRKGVELHLIRSHPPL